MKTLVLLILAAFALSAADRKITWDPDKSELSWISTVDGKTKFVVNFRTRLMTKNGKEPHRFSEEEAFVWMRNFIAIESYAIQSEDWHVNPELFEERHRRVAPPAQNNKALWRR